MNEIVKAGLVGAGFMGGIVLLSIILTWLGKDEYTDRLLAAFMYILGIILFIMASIVVGSLILFGWK